MKRKPTQWAQAVLTTGVVFVAANACRSVLGVDSDAREVSCVRDSDCDPPAHCSNFNCRIDGAAGGNSRGSGGNSGAGSKEQGGAVAAGASSAGFTSLAGGAAAGGTVQTTSISGAAGHAGATPLPGTGGDAGSIGGSSNSGGVGSSAVTGGASFGGAAIGGFSSSAGSGGVLGTAGSGTVAGSAGIAGAVPSAGTAGGGSLVDGGTHQGGSAGCTPTNHRCWPYSSSFDVYWQNCDAGTWVDGPHACADYCRTDDGCIAAPSCSGLPTNCTTNVSCCNSKLLPTGSFDRSSVASGSACTAPSSCPATVSSFSLDTFEVTVKRFRNFVDAYPTSIPGAAAGRNRHNGKDPGWNTDWNALLPQGQEALRLYLSNQSCPGSTFTAAAPVNDFVAMNCVSWYLAYAFCAWDGGRLPTEAEWNYAAAAGDENRYYPWSVPPTSTTIQPDQATYRSGVNNPTGPAIVGTASAGVARWGQFDLAGNVAEWVLDAWADPYAETAQCNDCANMNWGTNLRVLRGGSYASSAQLVRVGFRSNAAADDHFVAYGFRCARDL